MERREGVGKCRADNHAFRADAVQTNGENRAVLVIVCELKNRKLLKAMIGHQFALYYDI